MSQNKFHLHSYSFDTAIKEEISLELFGEIDVDYVRKMLPDTITPISIDGKSPIYLQIGHVESIWVKSWQLNTFHFDRALWHVAANYNGETGYYILHFETNNFLVRYLGSFFLIHKIKKASFSFYEKRKSLITHLFPEIGGDLTCHVELGKDHNEPIVTPKTFLSRKDGIHVFKIQNEIPEFCRYAEVDIVRDNVSSTLLGIPIAWKKECLVSRGKIFKWDDLNLHTN